MAACAPRGMNVFALTCYVQDTFLQRVTTGFHTLRPKWLISRRMAEISHSPSRNFSPRSEFK
jgi:hypothetical protein